VKHPYTRTERRSNAETWRNRQRARMFTWYGYKDGRWDPTENNMWWARKQSSAHGNRCMCHCEKQTQKRQRRRALDQAIVDNIRSWQQVPQGGE
jgi:hypothetical protein